MGKRKVDWVIEEWNKETDLPDEVKWVMYDLYTKDKKGDVRFNYNDFFDLDLSLVTVRKSYYRKAIIFLRKDKINKIKKNIDGQSTNR
jgi:hypothetical protein